MLWFVGASVVDWVCLRWASRIEKSKGLLCKLSTNIRQIASEPKSESVLQSIRCPLLSRISEGWKLCEKTIYKIRFRRRSIWNISWEKLSLWKFSICFRGYWSWMCYRWGMYHRWTMFRKHFGRQPTPLVWMAKELTLSSGVIHWIVKLMLVLLLWFVRCCRSTSAEPAVRRSPQQRRSQVHQTGIRTVETLKLTYEL